MELYDAIRTRRSIRKYKPDPIPRELLQKILEEALWAPSGMNRQPWYIYAVSGQKRDELVKFIGESGPCMLDRLEALFPDKMVKLTLSFLREAGGAPTILLIYMPKYDITITKEMSDFERHHIEHDRMGATQSASALIQNLILLAHAEGLGTCWLNGPLYLQKEINDLLGIEGKELVAAVTIGYPDQNPPVPPRKTNCIHWIE